MRCGYGVVLRDHEGALLQLVFSGMIGSALEAKLFVAHQVVFLAQDCCPSGSSIIFEGDSCLVLAAMKGKDDDSFSCSLSAWSPMCLGKATLLHIVLLVWGWIVTKHSYGLKILLT
ncbi:hypothetical protein ACFX11_035239 [Malus domestica]